MSSSPPNAGGRVAARPVPRPGYIAALLSFSACLPGSAAAQTLAQVSFDDLMLMRPQGQRIDIERFSQDSPVFPGNYTVDLYLNGAWLARTPVRFVTPAGGGSAAPCIDQALVQRLNLRRDMLDDNGRAALERAEAGECVGIEDIATDASYVFQLSELRLDLSVPQAVLNRSPQGYVEPDQWDSGVTAATLAYNANLFHTDGSGWSNDQVYIGLESGLNVGAWHLRNNSVYTRDSWGGSRFQNVATYLQRDVTSLRAQVTVGESFTDGALFDSIGMRGVQLKTDDRMLPDSMRGYAPVIRGIARTNALVTITQNGNHIYETTVPPGQFRIDDLYATGYGGDLQVVVTESDGSRHSFSVPYASVVQLLRPGIGRFSLAAGQVRDTMVNGFPAFVQGTYQYGFNNLLTGYGGVNVAEGYMAGLIGAAVNTPVGAFSFDFTGARAQVPRSQANTTGHSLRLSYSQMLPQTDTSVALAAYRYSSSGFWTFREAEIGRHGSHQEMLAASLWRQRNQFQATITQGLGPSWGNVYAIGSIRSYWRSPGTDTQFQIGYNNSLNIAGYQIGYNLSLSRERNGGSGQMTNQVFANVSVPLGRAGHRRRHVPTLTSSVMHSSQAGTSEQATLSGGLGEFNQFTYGVSAGHRTRSTTGSANAQYRGQNGTVTASVGGGTGYSQFSTGVSGAAVLHAGALSLANSLSDTIAIIDAQGAKGARVENWPGVRVDERGYAVLPYMTPYRLNTIQLDPRGLPLDVELDSTSQQVAPRANSVVRVRFNAKTGRTALLDVRRPNGAPVPFGAEVVDANGNMIGSVGQGGRAWLRGVTDESRYEARWGTGQANICRFDFRQPPADRASSAVRAVPAVCD